jgi:predicted O-linked N-acetylglucosamine transferase (SPINDLY family)
MQGTLARAIAAHQAGNLAEAEFLYKLVLQADKKQFDALHLLGVIEGQRGNFAAGIERLNRALRVRPKATDVLINLGRMQGELAMRAEAVSTYKKALSLDPNSPLAHSNLAILLRQLKQYDEAFVHCDRALALAPDYADARSNRGNVLFDLGRFDEALVDYDKAIALQPRHPRAQVGRGNVLVELRRHNDALGAYDRALASDPDLAEAWFGRGIALEMMRRHEEAFQSRDRAFTLKPDLKYAEASRLHSKLQLCDWTNLDIEIASFLERLREQKSASVPFMLLPMPLSASEQQRFAQRYVQDVPSFAQVWNGRAYAHDRIRLAYASSDFREHPVGYAAAGLFERHDRARFETTAISLGPAEDSPVRRRIEAGFERFIDCGAQSDREVADLVCDLEIDILVDLNGYTHGGRRGIFARRPAPVQVNYLGYAGTMGADYYQYIVADRAVIPPEHFEFFDEKVVWLPDTFLVTDVQSVSSGETPQRSELQLPDTGLVFCCFNQSMKLGPAIFDVWMRLLQAVDDSVLWLRDSGAAATRNLRNEAVRSGVNADRLVFAPRVPLVADHLARHRQADLFLDTLNYNAHTTGSDALFAGVPIVTQIGSTFAARVGASLNHTIGMPELVAESLQAYEALALKIARQPALLASLKAKLADSRENSPLFDTARFTRNIEAAYMTMYERYRRGDPPENFAVQPA